MNRQQRHAIGKGLPDARIDITGIVVHFANGQYVNLDLSKAQVVDKDTGRPLFQEVLDGVPAKVAHPRDEFKDEPDKQSYTVEFDTPEGKMIFVKEGNWSGVKKK